VLTSSQTSRMMRSSAGALIPLLFVAACSRKESTSSDAPAVTASVGSQAPAASVARAPATLPPLTGLDSCLVGKWKATGVTLKLDAVSAEGGANVTRTII